MEICVHEPAAEAVGEIAGPQPQHNTFLRLVRNLEGIGMPVTTGSRLENGSADIGAFDRKERARTYLARVVALTGATQMDNGYDLTVGKTRFHVRYRYVRRLRDLTDPQGAYEETCFYPAEKEMPKSEHIATALLQLKNNPALFDRWAAQGGAVKADGQAFRPRGNSLSMRMKTKFTPAERVEEYLERIAGSLEPSKTTMALTVSEPGVRTSWWAINSYVLCHAAANRRAFLLRRTRICRARKWLRAHYCS